MITSMVLCNNLSFNTNQSQNPPRNRNSLTKSYRLLLQFGNKSRGFCGVVANAKKKGENHSKRKRGWWQRFFIDEEGNWLGLKDDDVLDAEAELSENSSDEGLSEEDKFEAWKRRAEAIVDLREAQEDIVVGNGGSVEDVRSDPTDLVPEKGFVESVRDLVFGREEDGLLYEDRVFRYASLNSAKFLAVLIIIPWALDFAVHDYVLLPFLDRYVKTVPLAAQMLGVRKNQKLEMIKEIKLEKARLKLEVEIGKSPPLSDEEEWRELRHKVLELRDEWRLENRRSFANIWSDMVFEVSIFVLLYFNQSKRLAEWFLPYCSYMPSMVVLLKLCLEMLSSIILLCRVCYNFFSFFLIFILLQVALLKFTGYKILNNVSDTGKAFLIMLITDIFLGYHCESGWQTLLEVIVEHHGLEVDQSAITIFIYLVPVVIDACVKLWLFKYLPRLSPKVANIFREMKRH
ncbi:chloroplast envelope membrane protein isoform X1 [Populus alba x Populus x berolinensis]|nr:chloroplast envelope membrane protein isoform X1 [Populus alba x Populus x berolinensis]